MTLPIRVRLAVVCAALVGLLLVGLGGLIYLRLEADLRAAADDGLLTRAQELLDDPGSGPTIDPSPSEVGDIFAQIIVADGTVIAATPGIGAGTFVPGAGTGRVGALRYTERRITTPDEPMLARVLELPTPDGGLIVTGVAFDDQREILDQLLTLLAIGGVAAVALAGAVGWLVAGAALRPVERMRVESEVVSASDPGRRLAVPQTRDEMASLAANLNKMLDRLEAAVELERRFVADAGHELRTPLANLKAELDLAGARARTPTELLAALRSASEETDRLSELADKLLLLASADGGRLPVRREDVDVGLLAADVVERFAARASAHGLSLETSVENEGVARVDPTRIRQVLGNLIENAMRHTPAGGRIVVEVAHKRGVLDISVADSGEGFGPTFLPHAFEAFARADPARSRSAGGTGLGLAIVRAVAEGHGGSAEARNRDQGGAVVRVRIPA